MTGKQRRREVFSVSIDPALFPRFDRIEEAFRKRHPHTRITHSDAGRAVIYYGLDAVERELGLSSEPNAMNPRI